MIQNVEGLHPLGIFAIVDDLKDGKPYDPQQGLDDAYYKCHITVLSNPKVGIVRISELGYKV